jgi:hypothetical protein
VALVTVTWFDSIGVTVEVALTTATSTCGIWDSAIWDAALWGPDETWTDVSAYVRSFDTRRGFASDLRAWSAGSATIVLDNRDGRFSPDNLEVAAPYVIGGISGIRPGRPVRIRMTYGGVTYSVWRGYVDEWAETWEPVATRAGDATMTMHCSDEWGRLSSAVGYTTASAGAGETCGARWSRILTAAGFTGTTDFDVGTVTLQATDLSTDPVRELVITSASEGGAIYVDDDGVLVGRDQYSVIEDTRCTTVQATFGDGPGEIPWTSLDVAPLGVDHVINIASYKRVGGTTQRYTDATSRAICGDRADRDSSMQSLVCQTNAQVLTLATRTVATSKDPDAQVKALTIAPRGDAATRVPVALGSKIRDLVEVIRRPPSAQTHTMTRSCFVAGIRQRLNQTGRWETTFDLANAGPYRKFAASLWDTGLWGSSDADPAAALWFY